MKNKHYLSAASFAAVSLILLASCQGRRADGTPNGETVDVMVEKATPAADTDTMTAAMPEAAAIPSEPAI